MSARGNFIAGLPSRYSWFAFVIIIGNNRCCCRITSERAQTRPRRRRKWIGTITAGEGEADSPRQSFPRLCNCPPNFPPLPHRRDSPSRGMHNDISAIKQSRLHALGSQMPFIHSAVNLCLRQKFNLDAGRSSILFQLSAVSQRLLSLNWNVEKLFSPLLLSRRFKDLGWICSDSLCFVMSLNSPREKHIKT